VARGCKEALLGIDTGPAMGSDAGSIGSVIIIFNEYFLACKEDQVHVLAFL